MQWNIGNMDKISFNNMNGFLESLKPRNQEIKKQETTNQETTKPTNLSSSGSTFLGSFPWTLPRRVFQKYALLII